MVYEYAERQWHIEADYYYECSECGFEGDIIVQAIADRFSAVGDTHCPTCEYVTVGVEVRSEL